MSLEFAIGIFKLPCEPTCPFNKKCAKKLMDGDCEDNINIFIKKTIYGTPSKLEVKASEVKFTTSNPNGKVSISDGAATVVR